MKSIVITIILLLVVGGAAFYGGTQYGGGKSIIAEGNFSDMRNLSEDQRAQMRQSFDTGLMGQGARMRMDASMLSGEIIAKDSGSMTIQLRDGGSKIIFLSDSTAITKSADGTGENLIVGENVFVNGSENEDGSVTAESIQISPLRAMNNQ